MISGRTKAGQDDLYGWAKALSQLAWESPIKLLLGFIYLLAQQTLPYLEWRRNILLGLLRHIR